MSDGLVDGRCWWASSMPEYHDEEWGRPVRDDRALFEKLCLEAFQSGLSWSTILRKRENFRAAFAERGITTLVLTPIGADLIDELAP